MTIRWRLFPNSVATPAGLRAIADSFQAAAPILDGRLEHALTSNDVVDVIKPYLQRHRFIVGNRGKHEGVMVPVAWGENGRVDLRLRVDAWNQDERTWYRYKPD
jgi:hypothetical protein